MSKSGSTVTSLRIRRRHWRRRATIAFTTSDAGLRHLKASVRGNAEIADAKENRMHDEGRSS